MKYISSSLKLYVCVSEHQGSKRTKLVRVPIATAVSVMVTAAGATWEFTLQEHSLSGGGTKLQLNGQIIEGQATDAAFGLEWEDDQWSPSNYVLYPGSVYNGNRFYSKQFNYSPPPNGPKHDDVDQTLHVNEIPQLSQSGASHLELLSHDCATPAIGVFFPARHDALLLKTQVSNELGLYGYEVDESADQATATLRIMSPGILHEKIHGLSGYDRESPDRGATFDEGQKVALVVHMHQFNCKTRQGLFDKLFEQRGDLFELKPLHKEVPFSEVWKILHRKHNATNWIEQFGLYQTSISNDPTPPFNLFQTGWCGGAITTLPMIQEGDKQSVDRSCRNLDLLFNGQTAFGYFQEYFDGIAWLGIHGKSYCAQGRPWTLTRRIGDALYFVTRQLAALKARGFERAIKPEWEDGLHKNLAAIARTWEINGTIGQYINVHSGEVEVSATASGGLIPAGLVVAAEYFGEPQWITLAEEIAEDYRMNDLADAITAGGPGDCLQAPDSESIGALVESFALLFDATRDQKWKQAARDATVQLASWAYSYDYDFPSTSALGEIGAQSRGAYIANVQNRCGVPGVCTLSGEGVLRAFRATNDWALLEFLRDVSHTIPQYMGRKDKLIPTRGSWGRKGLTHQPEGWICERVNVGRWGAEMIGEIAAYSCWCETAMMLVWNDLPGVYWDTDSGKVIAIDHVEAEAVVTRDGEPALRITNPTAYDAKVKILAENTQAREQPLPTNAGAQYRIVEIPAGSQVEIG